MEFWKEHSEVISLRPFDQDEFWKKFEEEDPRPIIFAATERQLAFIPRCPPVTSLIQEVRWTRMLVVLQLTKPTTSFALIISRLPLEIVFRILDCRFGKVNPTPELMQAALEWYKK